MRSFIGILGLITNFTYLDGRTHRRMRESLLGTFKTISILNLQGDIKRPHIQSSQLRDQNVFDIQQGTAIFLGVARNTQTTVDYSEIIAARNNKYSVLSPSTYRSMHSEPLAPSTLFYYLVPHDDNTEKEYLNFISIENLFAFRGACIGTERDAVCIQWSAEKKMQEVVHNFSALDEIELREMYGLYKDSRDWTVLGAQKDVLANSASPNQI